jgi:DNA mismatch repair protein MutH
VSSTSEEGGDSRARDVAGNDDGSLWRALAAATRSTRRCDGGSVALWLTALHAGEVDSATIHGVAAARHRRTDGAMLALEDEHVDDRCLAKRLPTLFTAVVSMVACMGVTWETYARRLRRCVAACGRPCE